MQKILYVEDDLSLIDGLQYTLEASGYMVDNAKTVKEALALFRKNTYDLLFCNIGIWFPVNHCSHYDFPYYEYHQHGSFRPNSPIWSNACHWHE